MKEIIEPSYTTIGMIFEKNFLFQVPKYQRYYSWEDEQVEDFIKDIQKVYSQRNLEHFFGGIVVVEKPIPGSNRQQRELIDGQQRITTTVLLIIALIRKYEKIIDTDNEELILKRIDKLKTKYLWYDDEINRKPERVAKLILSNADKEYFENIVGNHSLTEKRDSHKRMKRAYKKIEKFVDSIVEKQSNNDEKIDALGSIEDIIQNNCTIIFIDAKTRESAYKLFQVLNDRGAGLTEGDLLKSKTLESLETHFKVKQNAIEKAWDEILQYEPKLIEHFLRYYYASVCGYRVGRTTLYDEFLSRFFPDVAEKDSLTEESEANKVVETVNEILEEIKIYRKLICGVWPYKPAQPITDWQRKRLDILVNYLGFDIVFPILLAGAKLKEKKFSDLVHMLEKFMFRYKSICNMNHQKMSDLFMSEAVKIRQDPDKYRLTEFKKVLQLYIKEDCTDKVFSAGLSNIKYKPNGNNRQLKYLFSVLNEHAEWYESGAHGTPVPNTGTISNFDNISIEHICAQSLNKGSSNFSGEKVHNFYNLTLLTLEENERADNKTYPDKKDIYCNSNFVLNRYFEKVDKWEKEDSDLWEKHLIDMAIKIFVI